MDTFKMSDLKDGKIVLESRRPGGKWGAIREIAASHLKQKGEACLLSELVREVKAGLEIEVPQQAYNYTKNALKHDARFEVADHDGRKVVVRV